MSKARLLEAIQAGRLMLDQVIARFSEDQMVVPLLADGWSLKDVIAHITAWEQRLLGWLAASAHGDDPTIPAPGYRWEDIDQLNHDTYLFNRDRPLDEVMAGYRASLTLIFRALDMITEEQLNQPFQGAGDNQLWQYFAANTYQHYDEHVDQLLNRLRTR